MNNGELNVTATIQNGITEIVGTISSPLDIVANLNFGAKGDDGLTVSVNNVEQVNGNITLGISDILVDNQNILTDDELAVVQATSGTNTGDQDLSDLMKLDGSNSNIDVLMFNTAYVPTGLETTGEEYWDSANHTKSVVLEGGVTGQLFQEQHTYGKNTSAVNILNGQAVSISSVGGSFTTFALTDATDAVSAKAFAGIATQDIAINAFGYITTVGLVREINTDAWNEGIPVYVSCTSAGNLTTSLPLPDCYVIKVGTVEYKHAVHGRLNVSSTIYPKLEDLSGVNGTPLSVTGQIPVWDNENGYFDFTKNANDFKTYSGFENRTDSTISISGAGLFSVLPVSGSFNVFTNGTGKHVISVAKTVSVTDDQTITYIYFDSNGDLQKSLSPWDLSSGVVAPCAIVFKDGTNYALTDERHSYERNKSWHNWAHFNIGAMYKSGFAGTFGDSSLSVTQGVIYDEDIKFDSLATQTLNTIWWRNTTNGMRMVRGIARPYYFNATLKYDNLGVVTDVDNNKYVSNWVYASNDPVQPIYTVTGQQQSTTLAQARNTPTPVINLSTAEWKLLYKVIYQQTGGGAVFIEATDYRNVSTGVTGTSVTLTSHSGLTDRDVVNSHPATAIGFVPTGNIVATTVETALAELDSEKLAKTTNITAIDDTGITDGAIPIYDVPNKTIKPSGVLLSDLVPKTDKPIAKWFANVPYFPGDMVYQDLGANYTFIYRCEIANTGLAPNDYAGIDTEWSFVKNVYSLYADEYTLGGVIDREIQKKSGLVASYEVTTTGISQIDFTGLDILADGGVYEIVLFLAPQYYEGFQDYLAFTPFIYLNNDFVTGRYRSGNTSQITDSRTTFNGLTVGNAVLDETFTIMFNKVVGTAIACRYLGRYPTGTTFTNSATFNIEYAPNPPYPTNITSIHFKMWNIDSATFTDFGIPVGTKISIYKKGV